MDFQAFFRDFQDFHLAFCQRVIALEKGFRGQFLVNSRASGGDGSYCGGEFFGGSFLDHKAFGTGAQGAFQVSGTSKSRQYQRLGVGGSLGDGFGGGDSVKVGHLDVHHRNLGVVGLDGIEELATIAGLGDYLNVAFEFQQCRNRSAH